MSDVSRVAWLGRPVRAAHVTKPVANYYANKVGSSWSPCRISRAVTARYQACVPFAGQTGGVVQYCAPSTAITGARIPVRYMVYFVLLPCFEGSPQCVHHHIAFIVCVIYRNTCIWLCVLEYRCVLVVQPDQVYEICESVHIVIQLMLMMNFTLF
jgi:hypothetical protein